MGIIEVSNNAENIFHELQSVNSLVNEEINLKFLEIDPNLITAEEIDFDRTGRLLAWKQLNNAVTSIQDIQHSREGLVFVGVLGHFTSGKSRCSINRQFTYKSEVHTGSQRSTR